VLPAHRIADWQRSRAACHLREGRLLCLRLQERPAYCRSSAASQLRSSIRKPNVAGPSNAYEAWRRSGGCGHIGALPFPLPSGPNHLSCLLTQIYPYRAVDDIPWRAG
jgi:hypothetical protein